MFCNFYILKLIYQKKMLLFKSILYEIKTQYAGSSIGVLWVLISPLILIALYSIVYLYVLKAKPDYISDSAYILYLVSGLLMYLGFVQSIQKSSSSILQNKSSIYNTFYPIEFIPLRSFFSAFISMIFGLFSMLLYKLLTIGINMGMLSILLIFISFVFFSMGLSLIISLLSIGLRDTENILQYVFMILIFVTPIGFLTDQLPRHYDLIIYLNPLFYFINPLQKFIAFNITPSLLDVMCPFAFALFSIYLSGKFFRSFKLTIFELI